MSYEVLPHPADVRFRATGPTLADAFAEVVRAFADISESRGGERERHEVEVESEDGEALLFDFLARLILIQEVEGCAVTRAEDVTAEATDDGYRLTATVVGGPIEEALFDVKSPTYNEMRVEQRVGSGGDGADGNGAGCDGAGGDGADGNGSGGSGGDGAGDGEWVLEATLDI